MAALRTPLYKEFLTPILHRRFTGAAIVTLVICYAEAVALAVGEKSAFLWSWFPIGPAGLSTLLLFISALSIFVLRVAQLHIGARTTPSPFATFSRYLLRFNTLQTLGWYLFSAWWFSEVYMWSAAESANLNWVATGIAWERKRLNERPIYLRSVFFMHAVTQAALHLYNDYDRVPIPITKTGTESGSQQQKPEHPILQLRARLPLLMQNMALRAAGMSVCGPVVYAIFIRRTAWDWSLSVAKIIWDVPNSQLSFIPPYHYSIIIRSLTSGFFLIALWEFSNSLFSAYVAGEPLKKDQPLTSESRDPIGTSLLGLQAKREVAKTFAFWELAYISQHYETRRKAIFADIDRPSGSAWNSTMTLCLGNILAISNRISEFQSPSPTSAPLPPRQVAIERLPRISAPLRQDNILVNPSGPTTRREEIEQSVGAVAKSFGQSTQPPSTPFRYLNTPTAKKFIDLPRQKLLTQGQQERLSPSVLYAQWNDYLLRFLRTPFGQPFQQTFKRRVYTIVLGTPFSELNIVLDSIFSLNALAVASIKEDPYGKVAKDVPLLIRAYVSTVSKTEGFVATLPPHWTDVEFSESERKVEEVELILGALKSGLGAFVGVFGKYADELGMDAGEIRTAKTIAGMDGEA